MLLRFKFSSALYHARIDRKLTQEQASELLGISRRWFQKIEKGIAEPNLTVACKAVKEFGLKLEEIIKENDEKDSI